MLTQSIIEKSAHLAESVSAKGKTLNIKSASYLANLANSIPDAFKGESLADASMIATAVGEGHANKEEELAKKLAIIFGNMINIAKNEVNPICRDVIKGVDEYVEKKKASNAQLGYNINYIMFPSLLEDDLFLELAANYQEATDALKPFQKQALEKIDDLFTIEDFKQLMLTGSEITDAKINEYLVPYISSVWPLKFTSAWDLSNTDIRYFISLFLVANGTLNEKIEKANVVTQDEDTRLALMNFQTVFGRKVADAVYFFQSAINDKELLAFGDWVPSDYSLNDANRIAVFYDTYKEWVKEKGGCPESLFGYRYALNSGKTCSAPLIDSAEYYKGIYNDKVLALKGLEDMSLPKWIKDGIELSLSSLIASKEDYTEAKKIECQKRLNDALSREYYADSEIDIYIYETVCIALGINYDIQHVLIERATLIKKHYPDISVELTPKDNTYILLMTIIRVIGKWLSNQLEVK